MPRNAKTPTSILALPALILSLLSAAREAAITITTLFPPTQTLELASIPLARVATTSTGQESKGLAASLLNQKTDRFLLILGGHLANRHSSNLGAGGQPVYESLKHLPGLCHNPRPLPNAFDSPDQ